MTQPVNSAVGDRWTAALVNNQIAWWGGSFSSYTPVLHATTTDPTLGTGAVTLGRYALIGKLAIVVVQINFGTSGVNAGSGNYFISLPITPANPASAGITIGYGRIVSAGTIYTSTISWSSAAVMRLYASGSIVSSSFPGLFTANDLLQFMLTYEAA